MPTSLGTKATLVSWPPPPPPVAPLLGASFCPHAASASAAHRATTTRSNLPLVMLTPPRPSGHRWDQRVVLLLGLAPRRARGSARRRPPPPYPGAAGTGPPRCWPARSPVPGRGRAVRPAR